MNIGLIGAPGSGKTKLAHELAEKFGEDASIIDGYAERIEERGTVHVGRLSSYAVNIYVGLERYFLERTERMLRKHTITCGTLLDTTVYQTLNLAAVNSTLNAEQAEQQAPKFQAVIAMLSLMYTEMYSYDRVFYLPAREGDEDTQQMDMNLQAAVQSFTAVPVTILKSKDRANEAWEVIRAEGAE